MNTVLIAVIAAIAQKPLETRQVLRRGDDEDIPDASQHEHRDGVVHHRFVKDGEQLLADALGDGVETSAGAAC